MSQEYRNRVSITDCKICRSIPQMIELQARRRRSKTKVPTELDELEIVWQTQSRSTYETERIMLKRCPVCGTYYHQYFCKDDEDYFITEPYINRFLERYNIEHLKEVLAKAGLNDEKAQFLEDYPTMIKRFIEIITHNHESLNDNITSHVVQTLTDYFLIERDWDGLKEALLCHHIPSIVLETARDLIIMFGERLNPWVFRKGQGDILQRDITQEYSEDQNVPSGWYPAKGCIRLPLRDVYCHQT